MPISSTDYLHNLLGQNDLQSFISCDSVIESLALSSCPEASGNSSGQAVLQGHWEHLKTGGQRYCDGFKSSYLIKQGLYRYWNEDNLSDLGVFHLLLQLYVFKYTLQACAFIIFNLKIMCPHGCLNFPSSRCKYLNGCNRQRYPWMV